MTKRDFHPTHSMIFTQYALVSEAMDLSRYKLYTLDQFNVINCNDVSRAMLQDAVWADTTKLKSDPDYQDTVVKFLKGSIEGWAYCRDNPQKCADLVVAKGSKLGASHQLWQMNEINKLIWPSPNGAGIVDQKLWDQTVQVALNTKNADGKTVITKTPDGDGFNNNYVQTALTEL